MITTRRRSKRCSPARGSHVHLWLDGGSPDRRRSGCGRRDRHRAWRIPALRPRPPLGGRRSGPQVDLYRARSAPRSASTARSTCRWSATCATLCRSCSRQLGRRTGHRRPNSRLARSHADERQALSTRSAGHLEPIHPGRLAMEATKVLPMDTVIVRDGGASGMWFSALPVDPARRDVEFELRRDRPGPAQCVGAKLAVGNDRRVVLLTGD